MASALIDDESEGARTLQHSEGDEIHSPPPSHWSEPMYLFLMSRGPPKVRKTVDWLYGRDTTLGMPKPWLRLPSTKGPISLEPLWIRWTRPFTSPILLAILIAAYIVSCVRVMVHPMLLLRSSRLSFFARAQWYQTPLDNWADCTSSFWARNDECGLNGNLCSPFNSSDPVQFRCPARCPSVTLANNRAVGDLEVIYEPLVVGGGDSDSTYRGDSWICVAAVHA